MKTNDNGPLRIVVDGRDVDVPAEGLDGRTLLAAVGADPDLRDVLIRVDGGWARLVAPSDPIIGIDGEAHFRVHHDAALRYLRVDDRVWEWGAPGIQEHDIREIAGIPPERVLHRTGGDPLRTGELVDLTVDWVPTIVSRPGASRELTVPVTVNGRSTQLATAEVSFEDVVGLAYPDRLDGSNKMFTVTYRHGPSDRPEGSLVPHQSIRANNGVVFNVTATSKS